MYLIQHRICGACEKEIKEGDLCYQIEIDNSHIGFAYIHKICLEKKKPEVITYTLKY